MTTADWLIYNSVNRLFWNNDSGWGCPETAERFTDVEQAVATLPGDGQWVRAEAPEVLGWSDPDGDSGPVTVRLRLLCEVTVTGDDVGVDDDAVPPGTDPREVFAAALKKLDAFREAVQPALNYGMTLYRS